MTIRINSLYIYVRDMDIAIGFYEKFFECPVTEWDDIYSVFEIENFRFGLFAFEKAQEEHSFDSNCLPSVSFADTDKIRRKLKDNEICFPMTVICNNYVAEIVESEGDHIEVTAPVS